MDFKTLMHQLVEVSQKLTIKQKGVIAGSIIVVISFLVFLVLYKGGMSKEYGYSVLFDRTTPADSALIIQQLEKDGIPYKIVDEGTIKVPNEVVYKERISIAALGIPKESNVGYELFDKKEFGTTDFEQKIKYLRALEGELSRTIEGLTPIDKADIHLAMPKDTVFVQKSIPPTASVSLSINPLMSLSLKQITGIKNLVSASVAKMTPENVKVVDQNGEPLGDSEEAYESDMVKAQLKYKKDFEQNYEQKIVRVLAPIIGGIDKVVAKVSIDFDFAREDIVSEYYDPNSVPRSEQSVEEKKEGSSGGDKGGVPGAVSNIGPVEDIESGKNTEKYQKSTSTTNYEISKKVSNIKGEFATIKRLTAAVVVDGKYKNKVDEQGNVLEEKEFIPLDKKQIESITSLVEQSIGYMPKRGDEVTVSNFEFKPLTKTGQRPATKTLVDSITYYAQPLIPLLKYLFVAILLFAFYKKVIIPFSKKMIEETTKEEEEEMLLSRKLEEEEEGEGVEDTLEKFKAVKKKVEDQLGLGEEFNEDELKYDVLIEKMKALTESKTMEVTQLIQSLLKSEKEAKAAGGELKEKI